ncbi:hypothetical protein ABZP36_011610 [Zizania latifolia]
MGCSLRLSAWAAAAGFPPSPSDWRGRRLHRAPLARRRCSALSTTHSAAAASLGASRPLLAGTEHEWLYGCGIAAEAASEEPDYAKEMEVAVRVMQAACTLCQHVQDSLLVSDSGSGSVHSKLDRSSSPLLVTDTKNRIQIRRQSAYLVCHENGVAACGLGSGPLEEKAAAGREKRGEEKRVEEERRGGEVVVGAWL